MTDGSIDRASLLLSVQRALLGAISVGVRTVAVALTGRIIELRIYFDGPISVDDEEAMSCVASEVLADFPSAEDVTVCCMRKDAPEQIDEQGTWVFQRREA